MEEIEYLDEYKDLVLPGIKIGDVRQPAGARRRRISSDSSNSSSLDADIFQKLFLDKSVDDDLINLTEGSGSKSQSRRHRSPPSSSDDSNDALDALFNRKPCKSKPHKRRERFSSYDSVDDLGQALMRSTKRLTVPKPSTSQGRLNKAYSDALFRSSSSSSSSSDSSLRGKLSSRKPKPAQSGKGATAPATAAAGLSAKYKNPGKPNTVNGNSSGGKNKAVTILKAQKTDLKPPKHEPKTDPLNLTEFFGESDSDSSYTFESDFFDDHDSADEDAEPVIDISTDTSRTTSVADTVTPVVSDDNGPEPEQREQDEQNEENVRSQPSIMKSVIYERLQSYLNNLSCAEAPPIYKKQSFARKSRSNEKKPSSSEQVKHANERSVASGKVQEEEQEKDREPTKASGSAHSSPTKANSASRRLFEVDDDLTLETLQRMTQDLAEQILEIDVERSVEYQKRSGSKPRSRSTSKIPGEPGTESDLGTSHVRKLTYSSERLDNGDEPAETNSELRRSKSESAFPKRGRSQGKKPPKSRAATTEDSVLDSAKEGQGEVPVPVKRKRGRPPKKQAKSKAENVQKPMPKDPDVPMETSGVEVVKEEDLMEQQAAPEERELNSELEKAKEFAELASQDDINMSSPCHQETDLKSAPDRSSGLLHEDAARKNLEEEPQPTVDTSTESFDTAVENSEASESVVKPQELDSKDWQPQSETTQKDSNEATMAIKELEEIESAIETAGEIALTPELADALDASAKTSVRTGNILEESDSQLAEDIKLAEEILAAEVGKGIEVTEAAVAAAVVGDQDPVIDIVKELEQETITEAVEKPDEESLTPEGQTEVEEQFPTKEPSPEKEQSPVKGHNSPANKQPPAKGKSPTKAHSPAKSQSPTRWKSPAKGTTPTEEKSPTKSQSPTKELSPDKGTSPEEEPPLPAEQSPKKGQSFEAQEEPHKAQEQSSAKEDQAAPTKESEDLPRVDTPTNKLNSCLEEATESSIARRSLRSDKPETPESTAIKQTKRKSRAKLPLLKDDSSRRSSPRLGRSPAESHSSQERSKLVKDMKSPAFEIEAKHKCVDEANNPVKDLPVAEYKPSSDETDAKTVVVMPLKKRRGRKAKETVAKPSEELPLTSKLTEEQSTSSEAEQKAEPTEIQADEQSKEEVEDKPSSTRKSRSRKSLKGKKKGKPESESTTESSAVEKEENPLRASSKGSDLKPETSVERAQISSKVKSNTDSSPPPAKSYSSSRGRETPRNQARAKEKETSKDRNVKSKSETATLAKSQKDKSGDSAHQTETEPEKCLKKRRSRKINPTPESKANPDPFAKESADEKNFKKKATSRKGKGDTKPKEDISTETDEDMTVDVETVTPTKVEPAEIKEKPVVSGVKRGRFKKRKQAVALEDTENDQSENPSDSVSGEMEGSLPTNQDAVEPTSAIIKSGKINQAPTPKGGTDSTGKESESKRREESMENKRKSIKPISASAPKETVSITAPPEASSDNSEKKPEEEEESTQTDAKNPSSSSSPSKLQDVKRDTSPKPVTESKTAPQTPSSTSLPCRKLRVLLKRTPTSNLTSKCEEKGNAVGPKATRKRKKFRKIMESIEEAKVPDLGPETESQAVCEPNAVLENTPVAEEVSKEATEDIQNEVPKEAAEKPADNTKNQEQEPDQPEENVSDISNDNATTEEAPPVQDPTVNETTKPSGTDDQLKEENAKKDSHKEEETSKETPEDDESPEEEKNPKENELSKDEEAPEEEEPPKEEEPLNEDAAKEEPDPTAEPLTEDGTDQDDSLAKETPTDDTENAATNDGELTPSPSPTPTPDPTETETTGVIEISTSSGLKRKSRKREADSSQPDEDFKRKLQMRLKSNIEKRKKVLQNERRRHQQEEVEERPALKRTKTDPDGNFISIIGNETIMTSPVKETRSEQPQTSQAAKRAGKGPNHAEITKHVIIPAAGKKPVDDKPMGEGQTKKPMVQTLLSSTLNLRKPLPGEASGSASTAQSRKSLGKPDAEASKALGGGQSTLVVTKKALMLPPSKKNESPNKEDKSPAASVPRKVNISVSVLPQTDTSSSSKSLETSPVLPRKVQFVEAQKTASRKSEAKKKVETKVAPPDNPLDKSKQKALKKPVVANPAKKTDAPAAVPAVKSLPVEMPKKTETRKSDGPALNSRKAPAKGDVTKARRSEGVPSLASRKSVQPKGGRLGKKMEPPKLDESGKAAAKSVESASTAEVLTAPKGREKAAVEQGKESQAQATIRMEKPTVAVTPRTVNLAQSIHMTRAASTSRSLAPTPTPTAEKRNAAKELLPPASSESEASALSEPLQPEAKEFKRGVKGRFKRIPAAQKRKALDAAEASESKRPKELPKEGRQQPQENLGQESRGVAFPVKITVAGLDPPSAASSKAPLDSQKPAVTKPVVPEAKVRSLRVRINRRVVNQWLKKQTAPRNVPPSADDVASDTESAAESTPETNNSYQTEPRAILMPPVPPLVPIRVPKPPSVQAAAPPTPSFTAPVPALPVQAPLPALVPHNTQSVEIRTPALPLPNEDRLVEDAIKKAKVKTTLPMPLPVPIPVAEVKSEPEEPPPEPMDGGFRREPPLVSAPPPPPAPAVPQTPLVADVSVCSTRQVMSAPTPTASNEIPSASAPSISSANSFGHTKLFSFLYPNRHSGKYGDVGLDFCCPNLDGPMAAIDPTRLHAKVEAPVLEMPQYLVITTKFISKADKNIPNKVRAKLELLSKDQELASSEGPNVSAPAAIIDPPGLATTMQSSVPKPPSAALHQPRFSLPAAPSASSSTPIPAAVPVSSSIDSLTKHLPPGTTLTKKNMPPGGAGLTPTASVPAIVASQPLSLIQLPTLFPADKQRTELQTRVQLFDLVLQSLSRRTATLTLAERQCTIEEMVKTSTLLPIDVDVGTKLLENYVHYLNKATSSSSSSTAPPQPELRVKKRIGISTPATPVVAKLPPTVATSSSSSTAVPQNKASPATDSVINKRPVYDAQKNIIGFKCISSSKVKESTPRRKAAPAPAPAATSTPLAASTSSAAVVAASREARFLDISSKDVDDTRGQMINLKTPVQLKPAAHLKSSPQNKTPSQKSAAKGTIIAIKSGSKAKSMAAPVKTVTPQGKASATGARGLATRGSPATRVPAVKPSASPASARILSSGTTTAAPSLNRSVNPNVFIINQASHAEESILPDDSSNVVVAPMEAEIKGELDDSSEAII